MLVFVLVSTYVLGANENYESFIVQLSYNWLHTFHTMIEAGYHALDDAAISNDKGYKLILFRLPKDVRII